MRELRGAPMNAMRVTLALLLGAGCVGAVVWIAKGREIDVKDPSSVKAADEKPREMLPIGKTGPFPKAVIVGSNVHEFEAMLVNATGTHTFQVKNEGDAPLKLQQWSTTCKCTLSSLEGDAIPPGETVDVKLEWTPKSAGAGFSQLAKINTNDPDHTMLSFQVSGPVWKALEMEPTGSWDLGEIDSSRAVDAEGVIYSKLLDEFSITEHRASAPQLNVDVTPMTASELKQVEAKSGYVIRMTMAPTNVVGKVSEHVAIKTDVDEHSEFRIQVTGQQMGAMIAYPYVPEGESAGELKYVRSVLGVGMGTIPPGEGRKAWYGFNLRKIEGKESKILDVKSSAEYVKASVEKRDSAENSSRTSFVLTIEVPADAPTATHRGDEKVGVTVTTDHPDASEIHFTVAFVKLGQ